ncbi:glycoside hydrolase family 9 protein [Pelagicoccus mobilis]|uniref:Glycoside hydrolase family 9 protein n=1 Tax=Pelagicoccus mobilis TaxID=415221 RepID=A0A934S1E8_9BACT|nr:glycoside hydrolase family 9 protein [Pelagicoccus mobilis]MBK1877674.1 glycoside hydrolase family 9 protein [Pelagicoccus mobilis]
MFPPKLLFFPFLPIAILAATNDPADGPIVNRVYPADHNVLTIEIIEGRIVNNGQIEYVPQDGDELRPDSRTVLAYDKDGNIGNFAKGQELSRTINGQSKKIGYYLEHYNLIALLDERLGGELEKGDIETTTTYSISSESDPNFASPLNPSSVARKSKPIEEGRNGAGQSVRHRIYLELPHSLETGQTYTVEFPLLNTQRTTVEYTHDSSSWIESIHTSQVGYHPGDPYKRAFLSLWKGTGGAHDYDVWEGTHFYLYNLFTQQIVHTGLIEKVLDASEGETSLHSGDNHTQTSVYALDFSEFKGTGRFVIKIEGLGISYPFPVTRVSWADAFEISMLGMLHHRSGIALGAPFTTYERPLTFHPDMGSRILQTDTTILHGESSAIKDSLSRLADTAEELPEAWGGYMDAGDWDRRSQHLEATYLQLELFEMYPEYFQEFTLSLPQTEANNKIPDLLDETLWNIEFYQRIQKEDGGVRGGVESTEHPRSGEASWQETLLIGAFEADPVSSYRFAATAAKAGRLLQPFDSDKGNTLIFSAERAWAWAEEHGGSVLNTLPDDRSSKAETSLQEQRPLAAVELFRATGNQDYHTVAVQTLSPIKQNNNAADDFRDAVFAYTFINDSSADSELKSSAMSVFAQRGQKAIDFINGNAFDIASDVDGLPLMGYVGYYSVPQMISKSLPRAHYLTGDAKYHIATIAACNFANGANPDNTVFTTGIGEESPNAPLHIDFRATGKDVPSGITVYGPSDPAGDYSFTDWVHTWRLADSMVPSSRTWPAAEWYIDLFDMAAMSEYTIHQTMGPTSYFWGYLAASAGDGQVELSGLGRDDDNDGLEDFHENSIIRSDTSGNLRTIDDVLPEHDFDNDGLSNAEEALSSSSPAIPGSGTLSIESLNAHALAVRFAQGESGKHRFIASTDLKTWNQQGSSFDQVGLTHSTTLATEANQSRFLRIEKEGD